MMGEWCVEGMGSQSTVHYIIPGSLHTAECYHILYNERKEDVR